MFRRINVLLAMLFIFAALFAPAQAAPDTPNAPGDLDTTFARFGAGGVVTETGLNTSYYVADYPKGMALQPDGKVVTVSRKGSNLVVFRYLPNGQRDGAFGGGDGKAEIPPPEGIVLFPHDVALQSDGSIVVAGRTTLDINDDSDFLLVRLTPTGELDSSFEGGGIVTTNFSGNDDEAYAVLIQPDDKIVVCGFAYAGGDSDFAVARYLPGGAPDTDFSNDGEATIGFGDYESCNNLGLQGDGKLVLVGGGGGSGTDFNNFTLARLNTNGTLDDNSDGDGGFSGDGKVSTNLGDDDEALDVAIQPDGKIVVAGNSIFPDTGYIARYLPNGDLDGTFGSGGKKIIPGDPLFDLELQPDGKLVALGFHPSSDVRDFAFYRLLSNGDPDPTFDEEGVRWLDFGGAQEIGLDLALLPDGRILGFGRDGGSKLITVQLWPDGTLNSGGQQTHSLAFPPIYGPGSDATTSALAVQPDGKLLVAGELRNPLGVISVAFITRFLSDGRLDVAFGNQGSARFELGKFNVARAIAIQPDGKIVIAGYSDFNDGWIEFFVARFNANGAPDATFGEFGNNYRVANFSTSASVDLGYALALAPDGKIVVAGTAWNGTRQIWGVARWNSSGTPDTSFDLDGKAFLDFGPGSAANAVVVQPDGKVLLGGKTSGDDFTVARLLANGAPDTGFGPNHDGSIIHDMGGADSVTALALASNGWIYPAGYSWRGGADDFALAQYRPNGTLAECPVGQTCNHWPQGKRYVSLGGSDSAYALVLRGDNQLVAAGCSDWHMAAVQVSTTDVNAPALEFETDFVGHFDCAFGVQFSDASKNKIVLAGQQAINTDGNIALARFQTTPATQVPPTTYQVFIPLILR